MMKRRFGKRFALGCGLFCLRRLRAGAAGRPRRRRSRLINAGDVSDRSSSTPCAAAAKKGKRVNTYQLVSEPRRLPPPNGLCGLETGPETFQIVTSNDAQAAQLKGFIGKEVSVKVDEVACAQDAGQMSEAVVTKWSVVTKH